MAKINSDPQSKFRTSCSSWSQNSNKFLTHLMKRLSHWCTGLSTFWFTPKSWLKPGLDQLCTTTYTTNSWSLFRALTSRCLCCECLTERGWDQWSTTTQHYWFSMLRKLTSKSTRILSKPNNTASTFPAWVTTRSLRMRSLWWKRSSEQSIRPIKVSVSLTNFLG